MFWFSATESEVSDPASTLFIDKPFVPRVLKPRGKNEWYHRFAVKALYQHPHHPTRCDLEKRRRQRNTGVKARGADGRDCFETQMDVEPELDVFGAELDVFGAEVDVSGGSASTSSKVCWVEPHI